MPLDILPAERGQRIGWQSCNAGCRLGRLPKDVNLLEKRKKDIG
jgi:hypothetical protein